MEPETIWVRITGGVMGFTPEDMRRVRKEWRAVEKYCSPSEFWDFFTDFFQEQIGEGKEAYGLAVV